MSRVKEHDKSFECTSVFVALPINPDLKYPEDIKVYDNVPVHH